MCVAPIEIKYHQWKLLINMPLNSPHPHILFLTKYSYNGASSRYRTFQYLPCFERAGFRCTVSALFSTAYLNHKYRSGRPRLRDLVFAFFRRIATLNRAANYDLVVIEKEIFPFFPSLPERWLAFRNIPYIVDYDDALFHQYDKSENALVRGLLGNKIAGVMKRARLVIVGNEYLARYARQAGASQIEILPTVIDLHRYPQLVDGPKNPVFTIGWIGSPSTAKYMEQLAPALAVVCAGGVARVRLVGSGEVNLPNVPHEVLPWSEDDEVSQLQSFDIGIMPLPDSPWERGKCGFKLIQYMACGLPVIASPVGVNAEVVDDGENGYLASTLEEWISTLIRLRDDKESRTAMGAIGRKKVENQFSLQVTAPRLVELLNGYTEKG